jgi:signal transduction histidine kinase
MLPGLLVLLGLYLTSFYSYLLFHSLAEIFSILVAWGIFVVAWNSRQFHDNSYLLFIGIAHLFIGGLDLVHTLAYKGMGVFQGYDANLPTQLWIATRYMESLSLFIAPLFLRRALKVRLVFLGYAVTTALLLGAIFYEIFPVCYVEEMGLTLFKKISEYVISLILIASIVSLLQKRSAFDRGVFRLLVASIIVTVASELAFTRYIGVYDLANLIGHLLKIVAFYLIYKALIETGLVRSYRLLFRDLRQSEKRLRREQQALRQYTAELQVRNEDLDAFAHTVAHDLKNPLAIMIGYAESLIQFGHEMTAEESRVYLEMIAHNGRKMDGIIQALLLFAGVRKMDVEMQPLDMASIVAEALKRLAPLIKARQAEITLPDAWPAALGYAPWVEEMWVNYLSNAVAYGGHPPRVDLGAVRQPDGMVRFWARDNGPGISAEDQTRLFIPFTHLDQVYAGGHGLGLSIVRRIAEKLGGQVGVESEVGRGSTFTFTLPGAAS